MSPLYVAAHQGSYTENGITEYSFSRRIDNPELSVCQAPVAWPLAAVKLVATRGAANKIELQRAIELMVNYSLFVQYLTIREFLHKKLDSSVCCKRCCNVSISQFSIQSSCELDLY